MKNFASAAASGVALCVHVAISWLLVSRFRFGLVGIALTLNFSWWATAAMLFAYVACGGCPETWNGLSLEAFAGLWEFVKLSAASGVMLWYVRDVKPRTFNSRVIWFLFDFTFRTFFAVADRICVLNLQLGELVLQNPHLADR